MQVQFQVEAKVCKVFIIDSKKNLCPWFTSKYCPVFCQRLRISFVLALLIGFDDLLVQSNKTLHYSSKSLLHISKHDLHSWKTIDNFACIKLKRNFPYKLHIKGLKNTSFLQSSKNCYSLLHFSSHSSNILPFKK